jgi:hypothetical protein
MEKNLQVRRHELKYYISRSDYEYARSLLSKLMKRDSNQKDDRGYFIRSLYLDDANESGVVEKLAGVENRDKYRMRIYDTNQDWVKLERKRKYNNYVQKSTGIITKAEAMEIAKGNYESLLKYKNPALNSIYFDMKRKYFRPVVIVDYIRDAYMLDYNDIRITFDKHLRSGTTTLDLFSDTIETEPLQRSEVIIMEVKFNNCLPSWFKEFFRFDSATFSAISKYCQTRMGTREYYYT